MSRTKLVEVDAVTKASLPGQGSKGDMPSPLKVGMVSLGCAKNLVDSEVMLGLLSRAGCSLTDEPSEADVLVVNTCTFIGPAKEESIDAILEMARYKEEGSCQALIVAGCMGTRYGDELMREMPEIDAVIGTGEVDQIPAIVSRVVGGERFAQTGTPTFIYDHHAPRIRSTLPHTAFIKISEGCNHPCAFCIIPTVRGRHRSRPIESIVGEAKALADQGVREVVLIAQDSTWYGKDLYGEYRLADLLNELSSVEGIDWFRLFYAYPTHLTDDILDVIASSPRICKYVELPLQHASDAMLKSMRRKGDRAHIDRLIERIRTKMPDVTLRSSFIVGYPGETEKDFQMLLDFLEEVRFDHVGIFTYSVEEGTPAASFERQLPENVKLERRSIAMELQRKISREKNEAQIGREVSVIVDGPSEESDLVLVARSQRQAPDVDGVTYVANRWVDPGSMVKVRITQAHDYDLVGEFV